MDLQNLVYKKIKFHNIPYILAHKTHRDFFATNFGKK